MPVGINTGLDFLAPTLTAVGLDPLSAGLQLVSAADIAGEPAPRLTIDRPALVAHVGRDHLAALRHSLLNAYPEDHAVTLVRWNGATETVNLRLDGLAEVGEKLVPSNGAVLSLVIPALSEPGAVTTLEAVMARLLSPDGCPWDREQTHQTLRKYLLEETYEVLDALDAGDLPKLSEELGDLLLQIVFHSQIATRDGEFRLAEVVNHIVSKLIRRHPHVFGDLAVRNAEEVTLNWEKLKAQERTKKGEQAAAPFAGIPLALPSLSRAQELQRRAGRFAFKWPDRQSAWAKFEEELAEWRAATTVEDRAAELGDTLFALVNVAQIDDLDAESALRDANNRFTARFTQMLSRLEDEGHDPHRLTPADLLARWRATA